jgi:hypothetical protein
MLSFRAKGGSRGPTELSEGVPKEVEVRRSSSSALTRRASLAPTSSDNTSKVDQNITN